MKSISDVRNPVSRPVRVLQFGEGNFLRAFADWMIDITNEKTNFNGNAVLIQPLDRGLADMINGQNGLYTTVLRGVQDGKTVEELRVINSVSGALNPYRDREAYLSCAENPDLRFIISNTTEAGIAYEASDKFDDRVQSSFPGKVTAFLHRRFTHFGGDPAKALVFIPCELIDKNGDKLREIVLRYAEEWNLDGAFIAWVAQSCDFCNSLVDRIVPGYPKEEAEEICAKAGYEDKLLDAAEIFHLWVIETKNDYSREFPLAGAGLNVIWTQDMSFYRTRKVRILNGAHTLTVPAAFLAGVDTVEECIKDPLLLSFMKKGIFEEIIPSMDGDALELKGYAADVLERFANPYIRHMLLSITLNTVSKFKTRDLPSLLSYMAKNKKVPPALAFSLSALIAFYEGTRLHDGQLDGTRNSVTYPVKDDQAVLEKFAALYQMDGNNKEKAARAARAVLMEKEWWGEDLTLHAGLEDAVRSGLESIWTKGMKAALQAVCSSR